MLWRQLNLGRLFFLAWGQNANQRLGHLDGLPLRQLLIRPFADDAIGNLAVLLAPQPAGGP
eukprot:11169926-Lingulodinium_polyedra.AAC.1